MPTKNLAERIRDLREFRGIEQATLARRVGVQPHTFWRYEAGQSRPRADVLDRIAVELGTTCEALLRGTAKGMAPAAPDPVAAVEEFLASADGQTVEPEAAALLRTLHWGRIVPTVAMVRSIWVEMIAGGGPRSSAPRSRVRRRRAG